MKTKIVITLTVLLVASIALSSFAALTTAAPKTNHGKSEQANKQYSGFELTATGEADGPNGKVPVTLTIIESITNGKIKTVFHLRAKGGDASITGYDTLSVTKGQGIIVNKNEFIHLNLMMSETYYGGRSTLWVLRGTTGELVDDSVSVHLESRRIVLPTEGHPQLRNLLLDGTITFYN